jgi:hypothetical protein
MIMTDRNANILTEEEIKQEMRNAQRSESNNAIKAGLAFSEYNTPFLYRKHMARDKITFERFSLVKNTQINKQESHEESNLNYTQSTIGQERAGVNLQKGRLDNNLTELDVTGLSRAFAYDQDTTMMQKEEKETTENSIKRNLKNMCSRPKRQIVEFYNDSMDKSLHSMIRSMAMNVFNICPEEGCGKMMLAHTDYYYHSNGCIEIKYVEDSNNK